MTLKRSKKDIIARLWFCILTPNVTFASFFWKTTHMAKKKCIYTFNQNKNTTKHKNSEKRVTKHIISYDSVNCFL